MSQEQPASEPAPPAPAPKAPPAHRWRARGAAGSARASAGRKLFFLVAALLALGGAVVAWLLFLQPLPTPHFLSLPIREYRARQLPANPFAVQDTDLLLKHFPDDHKRAYESQTFDRIRRELSALRTKTDVPVVVHLTALALHHDNEVYVLPGDADPDRPDTWLPLREVLSLLRQCPSSRKLLVLDVMKPMADPRLGVLVDDLAGHVKTAIDKESDAKLLVLCACEGNQVSLALETAHVSVFAFYLDQGLRGHADGSGTGSRDGRVSVKELATFVRERVQRWAWQNRAARQTPVLLGDGADFSLVGYEQTKLQSAGDAPDVEPYPPWLRAAWQTRYERWRDDSYRLAPLSFRRYEASLLRAEQRWRGGKEEIDLQNELKDEQARLDEQLKLARTPSQRKPVSVALLLAKQSERVDTKLRGALRVWLDKLGAGDKVKADDLKNARKEVVEKFQKLDHAAYVWTVFDTAVKASQPKPGVLLFLRELLEARADEGKYTEMMLLERIAALYAKVVSEDWDWPGERVQQALRVFRDAESAVAQVALDPFVVPWIRELLQSADKKRREGEKYLFQERPSQWDYADAAFRTAEERYRQVHDQLHTLRRARREWDRALALLPSMAPCLATLQRLEPQEERAWERALQAANKLASWLASPSPTAFDTDEDPTPRRELQEQLDTLQRLLAKRGERMRGHAESAEDALALDSLLCYSGFAVQEREDLWRAGRKLAFQLHAKTLELDRAEEQGNRPASLSVPAEDSNALRHAALRRARFSIDLAQLTGLQEIQALLGELTKAQSRPDASWQQLAKPLREFWVKQLPQKYKAAENKVALADRLGRLLPPFELDREGTVDPRHWSRNPTGYLLNQDVLQWEGWLGTRYSEESRALPEKSAGRSFYEEAAAGYLR